mgnify:CR=1 FL=1
MGLLQNLPVQSSASYLTSEEQTRSFLVSPSQPQFVKALSSSLLNTPSTLEAHYAATDTARNAAILKAALNQTLEPLSIANNGHRTVYADQPGLAHYPISTGFPPNEALTPALRPAMAEPASQCPVVRSLVGEPLAPYSSDTMVGLPHQPVGQAGSHGQRSVSRPQSVPSQSAAAVAGQSQDLGPESLSLEPPAKRIKFRHAWSPSETEALEKGLQAHGWGNWKVIKSDPQCVDALRTRTPQQLLWGAKVLRHRQQSMLIEEEPVAAGN